METMGRNRENELQRKRLGLPNAKTKQVKPRIRRQRGDGLSRMTASRRRGRISPGRSMKIKA